MRKPLIKLTLLLLFVLAYVGVKFLAEDYYNERDLKRALATQAQIMSTYLPQKLDARTTLVAVEAFEKTITYHYQMTLSAADLGGDAFVSGGKQRLLKSVCDSKHIAADLQAGVEYRYHYSDNSGARIFELSFKDPDCSI